MLYSELSKGYPVMCSGGEHAYVLDGYDSNTNLYHFNFGWGGAGDGYYPVDDSPNAMGGYSSYVTIVYDIHPQKRNIDATISCALNADDVTKVDVTLSVVNNSTLPVKSLCLYVTEKGGSADDVSEASWTGSTIENNGKNYSISFTIDKNSVYDNTTFFLTDEQKNVLAEQSFNLSGVESLAETEKRNTYKIYNMQGQEVSEIRKGGIYILENGVLRKKIYVR